jgi:DNA-directed RNA polymerase subunit E'/Rpb7
MENTTLFAEGKELYSRMPLDATISLLPHQLTSDMDNHLLNNLRKKHEKKAVSEGIVIRIDRLLSYDYAIVDKTNFMGTSTFNIKYEAIVCAPMTGMDIISRVENIVMGFIMGRNGKIITAIQVSNVDTQLFSVDNYKVIYKSTNKEIEVGDYIKLTIINININPGESFITTICKLNNMATPKEIELYNIDQNIAVNKPEDYDENVFI